MIKIKKIIVSVIILLFCSAKAHAVIEDALFATVGNRAITHSDIIREMKFMLISTGQDFSEEQRTALEQAAVNLTIKRVIKEIEISKYEGLSYNEKDIQIELQKMASHAKMDLETFRNTFVANDIDFSYVTENIKTELLWNTLIFQLYKDTISINIDEINEELKQLKDKNKIVEYLVSEIVIRPVSKDKLENTINDLKNKISIDGFEKVAINFSISESSNRGGDMGWVSENMMTKSFKSKVENTPIGEISDPVMLQEGIMFFKIRDKREQEITLEQAKEQLVKAEKSKVLNMYAISHYDKLRRSVTINYY